MQRDQAARGRGDQRAATYADGGSVAFIALEDEGGVVNVILRPEVFTAYRDALRGWFAVIEGTLQHRDRVCSVVGERVLAVKG